MNQVNQKLNIKLPYYHYLFMIGFEMLYTINFSIEAETKDELQKICDDLVSDLQSQSKQTDKIQLNQYSIDQDEEFVYIEAEVVNLNKDTLDYLIGRIKSGEFDPDFQQYSYFDQSFNENKTMDCFTYLLDKLKDKFPNCVYSNK